MQELEKILKEIDDLIEEYMSGDVPLGMLDMCAGMKKAQVIIRENMNDDWIPVEERLPEDGKTVLCTDGEYIYLVEYDADLDAPFGDMDGITHWQPSPEPYQAERSESRDEYCPDGLEGLGIEVACRKCWEREMPEEKNPSWIEKMLRKFDRRE